MGSDSEPVKQLVKETLDYIVKDKKRMEGLPESMVDERFERKAIVLHNCSLTDMDDIIGQLTKDYPLKKAVIYIDIDMDEEELERTVDSVRNGEDSVVLVVSKTEVGYSQRWNYPVDVGKCLASIKAK